MFLPALSAAINIGYCKCSGVAMTQASIGADPADVDGAVGILRPEKARSGDRGVAGGTLYEAAAGEFILPDLNITAAWKARNNPA